jgi:protein-tyrosine phosphatase
MKQSMTDIHQHLLWGMDDGAQTPELMQDMLRQSHRQGIRTVVATPHAVPGLIPFDLGLCRERQAEAQHFCDTEGLNMKVLLGAEIAWTVQAALSLRQSRIPTLGDTDYILLELWRDVTWREAQDAVRQLTGAGYCPVLAHPERYRAFLMSPKQTIRFREETGVLLQLNASTLLNPKGILQRRFIRMLTEARAADAVASDAHGCAERPVNMAAARDWLISNTDEAYAAQVTSFNGILTE